MFVSPAIYLDALFLLLGDNSERSKTLVKELMRATEPDKTKGRDIIGIDNDLIDVYKDLIRLVISENISQENQTAAKMLLLRIKSNEVIKSHPLEKDLLTDILTGAELISPKQIDSCLKRIRNMLVLSDLDDYTKKVFGRTRKILDIQDADAQAEEIAKVKTMLDDTVKVVEQRQNDSDVKASETYVSLSDRDSILRALEVFMDRNVRGVIKTGLQGLNKALGTRGGAGLGESMVFAASSHNYKSGMLVSFMLWTVLYNNFDQIVEPGRKPMVYFVSLENEVNQNLMDVFRTLYGRIEKKRVDPTTMSSEMIMEWLHDYFQKFNVELFIDRYQPHEFSFGKFLQRYNAFVNMGYQIVNFVLDYMSEARGIDPGDTISGQGTIQLIKENYTKHHNFAKSQGHLLVTGHQLTKKAEEVAGNSRYAVKKFNPSMMADSSDVHRTVDALFFLQLENNIDGIKFLTVQNRKNRGCKDTPERDKFFAYAFTEFGIEDDLEDLPRYVTDIDDWGIKDGAKDDNIVEGALF